MKMEGKMIPTELVFITFKSHFKEAYQQFYYAAEQITNDTIRKMGGGKKEIAEMKGALIPTLNETINRVREKSLDQVQSIRDEYMNNNGWEKGS